jgi:choline kinase
MQLIVLSAGRGSRLPQKFRDKPKCLVQLNSIPLLLYNKNFFKYFKNKIIVTGYKQSYLKKISKKVGFTNIFNKKYSTTNMVYSLFLTKKLIKDDVVIIYGDVIFNSNIYKLLKPKKNILPVNINWLSNWKKRMSFKNVLNDAENLVSKKGKLLEIGSKLNKKKLPKHQFMGIIKLKKQSYLKCFDYFKTLKNKKIDMTSFINLCVLNKIITLNTKKYSSYWYEIDTVSDHILAEKEIKKW